MGGEAEKHTRSSEGGCASKSGDKDSGIEVATKCWHFFKLTILTRQFKEKHKIILVPPKIISSGSRSNHGVCFFLKCHLILSSMLHIEMFAFKSNYFHLIFCSELPQGLPHCFLCTLIFCLPTFSSNKKKINYWFHSKIYSHSL